MRISELVSEDRVDEFLPAVGAAVGGLARGAAAVGQGLAKGAQAVGQGVKAVGQATGQAAKTATSTLQKSISAAGSQGAKILSNPKGITNMPINQVTKAMGIPNQGALPPDLKKAFGLDKIPGNLTVKSVNGPGNKDSVEVDSSQLGSPISLNKDTFVGALGNLKQLQAKQDAEQAEKDAQQADRNQVQSSAGGTGTTGGAV
jgi:hypothetical protein